MEKSFLMARTKCWRCYHTQQESEEWSKVTLYIDLHSQLHGDHIPEIILKLKKLYSKPGQLSTPLEVSTSMSVLTSQ